MPIRPGDRATDLDGIVALVARYETAWFGAPEQDRDEVAEVLDRVVDWAADLRVAGAAPFPAVAWRWHHDLSLYVDPAAPGRDAAVTELLAWLATGPDAGQLEILERDAWLGSVVRTAGWQHRRSAFELARDVRDGWSPAPPDWPAGLEVIDFVADHTAAVHELVYVDADWSAVEGHQARDLAEWHSLFLADDTHPLPPVVAWRAGRPVGVALIRRFSDGTGWVNQLAVARAERRGGLGRALLLAALDRLRQAGATRLALGVQAANSGALGLYLDVGLRVDREYRYVAPPTS